jgi:uncharacterized cupredoxin-like copper-binding protein
VPQTEEVATPPRISRLPVAVTLVGLALAGILVFIGAKLAAAPAPTPDLSSPGTADRPRPVVVIMRDYVFNPTPLYLVPGETVEFQVINAGMVTHEFVLGDASVQRAWAAADAAATPPGAFASPPRASVPPGVGGLEVLLAPGQAQAVIYVVPADEALQLVCQLPGHVARGMVGSVILATR